MEVATSRHVPARWPKNRSPAGWYALAFLRRHPVAGYFLLAYALAWAWEVPLFGFAHRWMPGPWLLLCPSTAAFLMAWIIDGRAGVGRLLRLCARWRVGPQWYLVVLLTIPALYLLGLMAIPGAPAAFRVPPPAFVGTYLVTIALAFVGPSFGEEAGWRGFALPRLQARYGPLAGTLVLGTLWGFWHLPLWLQLPGHSGAGTGWLGIGIPFLGWFAFIVAFAVVITWVANHTGGSVLLAMLWHASIDGTYDSFPGGFFPTLFPPEVAAHAAMPALTEAGVVALALLLVVFTRGRLGYDQHQREFGQSASSSDGGQEASANGASGHAVGDTEGVSGRLHATEVPR